MATETQEPTAEPVPEVPATNGQAQPTAEQTPGTPEWAYTVVMGRCLDDNLPMPNWRYAKTVESALAILRELVYAPADPPPPTRLPRQPQDHKKPQRRIAR